MRKLVQTGSDIQKQQLLQYFPLDFPPRPVQEQAIADIAGAFDTGKRFVFFEGPPGVGKSAIAMALARQYQGAYICTVSKLLQAQYMGDFAKFGLRELYGRPHFRCHTPKPLQSETCEETSIAIKRYPDLACSRCPYKIDKAHSALAPFIVANYHSYIFNISLGGEFSVRGWSLANDGAPHGWNESDDAVFRFGVPPLLVLDEGHEVEKVLLDFVSVSVCINKLPFRFEIPLPKKGSAREYFGWLREFMEAVEQVSLDDLSDRAGDELEKLLAKAKYALKHEKSELWVVEDLPNRKDKGFVLKPLTVGSFSRLVFQKAPRVLIMSATILSAEKMMDSLGIDRSEAAYFAAPCPFPKENRPIITGGLNMTKKHREESWPLMLEQIEAIMEEHKDEKGLILTPSNEMLRYIENNLPGRLRARLIAAFGASRKESYQAHLEDEEATVLIASGMWEGIDLKDDASRFQIIPALPRPHFSGQIAARTKVDSDWYRWRTMTQLIQGVGRSVRNETDSAHTYILDLALEQEAQKHNTYLPTWFREAIQ